MLEEEIIVIEDDTEEELIVLEEAIEYITPTTQEKTIIPLKVEQIVKPDEGIFALSQVTVEKIPDEYINPIGDIEISSNGTYDVREKANAIVNVPEPTGTVDIDANGTYNVKEKEFANVNVPEKQLGTKTITSNGIYNASDDGLDGYSSVDIQTSGADISEYFDTTVTYNKQGAFVTNYLFKKVPTITIETGVTSLINSFRYLRGVKEINIINNSSATTAHRMFANSTELQKVNKFDTSKIQNMEYMFDYCTNLKEVPEFDMSNCTKAQYMLNYCSNLKTIPQFNTIKVTNFSYFLSGASAIESIPKLNASATTNIQNMFSGTKNKFTDFGGLENLGMAYGTTTSANNSSYKLALNTCNNLTEQSLINVLTNLYDIASKGCKTQTVQLGTTNLARLTSEAGQQALAQAQSFGWTIN